MAPRNCKTCLAPWSPQLASRRAIDSCFLSLSYSSYLICLHRALFVFNLTTPAGPPTLKNLDFAHGICYFLINRRFLYKDALQRLSGLDWAHLLPSWGALWDTFGGLGAFRWLPEILKLPFWHLGISNCLPKSPRQPPTAPQAPSS